MAKGKLKTQKLRKEAHRGIAPKTPPVLLPDVDAAPLITPLGRFDLDDPHLPKWVAERAFRSGGFVYDTPLKTNWYEHDLRALQIELVKLQKWAGATGARIVLLFEGRDAAGKDGSIAAIRENLNPRSARVVALPKPTEAQRGQWYFQRYAAELPAAGEIVLFDRSWYNRAGVEPVMGFCIPEEHRVFLQQAPVFERLLVEQGISLFKFWLEIGWEMQLLRFHDRRHNPLRIWKLSPIDYAALTKWDYYTAARDRMLAATHTPETPWTVVKSNDKKRARLAIMRLVLGRLDFAGRDVSTIGEPDPKILGNGPEFLEFRT